MRLKQSIREDEQFVSAFGDFFIRVCQKFFQLLFQTGRREERRCVVLEANLKKGNGRNMCVKSAGRIGQRTLKLHLRPSTTAKMRRHGNRWRRGYRCRLRTLESKQRYS